MHYQINEVDGNTFAGTITFFNALVDNWPPLQERHLTNGYWWLVNYEDVAIAFAGLVPFEPFLNIAYLKRCFVMPEHRGHSLQQRLLFIREAKAKCLGFTHVVSDCHEKNLHSITNFQRAQYQVCDPEQKWEKDSIYWIKEL